jgi:exosortase A
MPQEPTILLRRDLAAFREVPAAGWQRHALTAAWLSGLIAALIALYGRTLVDLVQQWSTDENASHGFLIPLVAAYLIWDRRNELRRALSRVCAGGVAVLLAAGMLFFLGQAAAFGYPSRLAFVVSIAGLVLFLYGPSVLRLVAFPIAYLLFMIPLPVPLLNMIAFPLQLLAARTATTALDLMSIPVLREGNIIDLPATRLDVTEACSGIRSLAALLALGAIYAYLTRKSWPERIVLTLTAVPIAIVANAARITTTGVLAQLFGSQAAQGFYHLFSGWLIFLVAFALLVLTERLLPRIRPAQAQS